MKILMFTPYVPYPPNSGGQTRTFNLIKNLSRKHEITSFSFLRTDHQEPDLTELSKYCHKIAIFRRKKSFHSPLKVLRTGFSRYPYLVNMYRHAGAKRAITAELKNLNYDLIHVETYYILPNLPKTSVPVLLAEQTIEYQVYQHYAQMTNLWPLKPLLYIDVAKHKYWEKYYWRRAQKVVAMSDADKNKMLEISPGLDVSVVPNGVDTAFFTKKIAIRDSQTILFVGNFNWLQNREAAEILAKKIWPLIRKQLPQAKLWIVGREPTLAIQKLATSDIQISSDIEDIRLAYQSASILVAPIYGMGGTRYKILEAMASNLPVVTTPIGIEGIRAEENKQVLVGNGYSVLVDKAVMLIKTPELAKKIAANAREFVSKHYDWGAISSNLEKIYEQTAQKN